MEPEAGDRRDGAFRGGTPTGRGGGRSNRNRRAGGRSFNGSEPAATAALWPEF